MSTRLGNITSRIQSLSPRTKSRSKQVLIEQAKNNINRLIKTQEKLLEVNKALVNNYNKEANLTETPIKEKLAISSLKTDFPRIHNVNRLNASGIGKTEQQLNVYNRRIQAENDRIRAEHQKLKDYLAEQRRKLKSYISKKKGGVTQSRFAKAVKTIERDWRRLSDWERSKELKVINQFQGEKYIRYDPRKGFYRGGFSITPTKPSMQSIGKYLAQSSKFYQNAKYNPVFNQSQMKQTFVKKEPISLPKQKIMMSKELPKLTFSKNIDKLRTALNKLTHTISDREINKIKDKSLTIELRDLQNGKELSPEAMNRLWMDIEVRKMLVKKGYVKLSKEDKEMYDISPYMGDKEFFWKDLKNVPKYQKANIERMKDKDKKIEERRITKEIFKGLLEKENLAFMGLYTGGLFLADAITSGLTGSPYGPGDVIDPVLSIPDIVTGAVYPTPKNKAIAYLESLDIATDKIPWSAIHINARNVINMKNPIEIGMPIKTKENLDSSTLKVSQNFKKEVTTKDIEKFDPELKKAFLNNIAHHTDTNIKTVINYKGDTKTKNPINTTIIFNSDGSFTKTREWKTKKEVYKVNKSGKGTYILFKDKKKLLERRINSSKINKEFNIFKKPITHVRTNRITKGRTRGVQFDKSITTKDVPHEISGWLSNKHFVNSEIRQRIKGEKRVETIPIVRETYKNILKYSYLNGIPLTTNERIKLKREIENYVINWKGDNIVDDIVKLSKVSKNYKFGEDIRGNTLKNKANEQLQEYLTTEPKVTRIRQKANINSKVPIQTYKKYEIDFRKPFTTNEGFVIGYKDFPHLNSIMNKIKFNKVKLDSGVKGFYDSHKDALYISEKIYKPKEIKDIISHERLHQLIRQNMIGEKTIKKMAKEYGIKTKGKTANQLEEEVINKIKKYKYEEDSLIYKERAKKYIKEPYVEIKKGARFQSPISVRKYDKPIFGKKFYGETILHPQTELDIEGTSNIQSPTVDQRYNLKSTFKSPLKTKVNIRLLLKRKSAIINKLKTNPLNKQKLVLELEQVNEMIHRHNVDSKTELDLATKLDLKQRQQLDLDQDYSAKQMQEMNTKLNLNLKAKAKAKLKMKTRIKEGEDKVGYAVEIKYRGKRFESKPFRTKKMAESYAMDKLDKYLPTKAKTKKKRSNTLTTYSSKTNNKNKFYKHKGIITEKRSFRNDSPRENRMDWMRWMQ